MSIVSGITVLRCKISKCIKKRLNYLDVKNPTSNYLYLHKTRQINMHLNISVVTNCINKSRKHKPLLRYHLGLGKEGKKPQGMGSENWVQRKAENCSGRQLGKDARQLSNRRLNREQFLVWNRGTEVRARVFNPKTWKLWFESSSYPPWPEPSASLETRKCRAQTERRSAAFLFEP